MPTTDVCIDYGTKHLPPRCRKTREVQIRIWAPIHIQEVSEAEAPVAMIVTPNDSYSNIPHHLVAAVGGLGAFG